MGVELSPEQLAEIVLWENPPWWLDTKWPEDEEGEE